MRHAASQDKSSSEAVLPARLQVLEAQGAQVGMQVIAAAIQPHPAHPLAAPAALRLDRAALIGALDALSVALGLLINLAESLEPQQRGPVACIQAGPGQPAIQLLCQLLAVLPPQ